jgi:hypothetical protein
MTSSSWVCNECHCENYNADRAFCILCKVPRLNCLAVVAAPTVVDAAADPVVTEDLAPAPMAKPVPVCAPCCVVGHPVGMVLNVVGTNAGDRGRCCKEHTVCGNVLKEDVVGRLRKERIVVPGLPARFLLERGR